MQQESHEKQSLFSVQEHGRTPHRNKKRQSNTRQTEGHRLNTQGNETQVETIRALLETIRKETDTHREGRAGKQETRQGLQHKTGNTQILTFEFKKIQNPIHILMIIEWAYQIKKPYISFIINKFS